MLLNLGGLLVRHHCGAGSRLGDTGRREVAQPRRRTSGWPETCVSHWKPSTRQRVAEWGPWLGELIQQGQHACCDQDTTLRKQGYGPLGLNVIAMYFTFGF